MNLQEITDRLPQGTRISDVPWNILEVVSITEWKETGILDIRCINPLGNKVYWLQHICSIEMLKDRDGRERIKIGAGIGYLILDRSPREK